MPLPCHALTMPFFSRTRHSTAVDRRPVGYLWLLLATTPSSTNIVTKSIPILLTTIRTYDCKSGNSTLQKKTICWPVGLAVQIFPATARTLTKDTALSEQGRGTAWHVWINARHCRETAWARHRHGMLYVNPPWKFLFERRRQVSPAFHKKCDLSPIFANI
jgi:hypothetical protein